MSKERPLKTPFRVTEGHCKQCTEKVYLHVDLKKRGVKLTGAEMYCSNNTEQHYNGTWSKSTATDFYLGC